MIFRALIRYSIDRPPYTIEERCPLRRKMQIDHLRKNVDPNLEALCAELPEEDEPVDEWWDRVQGEGNP